MTNAEIDVLRHRVTNGGLLSKDEQLNLLRLLRRSNKLLMEAKEVAEVERARTGDILTSPTALDT